MPEVNQYLFSHKELLELLIKKAGLHEGKWQLIVNFGFGAANIGPSPEQINPAAAIGILNVGLQKAVPESLEALTADAAIINPSST